MNSSILKNFDLTTFTPLIPQQWERWQKPTSGDISHFLIFLQNRKHLITDEKQLHKYHTSELFALPAVQHYNNNWI
jgi:hypothetical protein